MSDEWTMVAVAEVQPGDRVRHRGFEFEVGRVDQNFLGRDNMVCMIEDTPDRWHAYPAQTSAEVEVLRTA
jgi:hypothetical protein